MMFDAGDEIAAGGIASATLYGPVTKHVNLNGWTQDEIMDKTGNGLLQKLNHMKFDPAILP
jgi:hypothetical protein